MQNNRESFFIRNEFPTAWQRVIFRNYRMVPAENIAKIINCTPEQVEKEALRMGLRKGDADPEWLTKGYITVIRDNWHILTRSQICTLIGFSPDKLSFVLAKDDFLGVKLSRGLTAEEDVHYAPLTDAQIAETEKLAKIVSAYDVSERKMFDFFTDTADTIPQYITSADGGTRMVHGFLSPCADPFLEDTRSHLPDVLLDSYAEQGINVLFIHALLSTISPYPFDPETSRDYPVRRKNLQDLIDRAAARGIRIYLYFNEPRAVLQNAFDAYGKTELAGVSNRSSTAICLQTEAGREYLYNATRDLFENVSGIGGIFNITMSENFTHCRCHGGEGCGRDVCRNPGELPVLINNIMHKAIRDAGSDAEVINYAWGWNWDKEELDRSMAALHPEIAVMQVSENALKIEKGGVEVSVDDYSISNPGPSEKSEFILRTAAKYGHKLYAKVQINCSWECACVPYLPLFDIQIEHLQNLHKLGVNDLMMTWTLGGYPSIAYDEVAAYLASPETFSADAWYKKQFGDKAEEMQKAVHLFCEGFREYPFSIGTAYFSPKTLGAANLWSFGEETRGSSMVCFASDNPDAWAPPYPLDVYTAQFRKMLDAWDKACDIFEAAVQDEKTAEIALFARFAALQLRTDVIHTEYTEIKKGLPGTKNAFADQLKEMREIVIKQLPLMEKSSLIGYETSNHYFFTERNFIEKLIQIENMLEELESMT
ncbi:MAG: hypothetical protein E7658_05745 [Ruminococcaceae bacterium]|nr:hypothetical protein [Oscillospiraceae bacterium]